jgi:hypothetical protein
MSSRIPKLLTAAVLLAVPAALPAASPAAPTATASAKTYQNCTALNRAYPHGVGRSGARDKTSGAPVTNFKRSKALYMANRKSDRDGDGIACEKA